MSSPAEYREKETGETELDKGELDYSDLQEAEEELEPETSAETEEGVDENGYNESIYWQKNTVKKVMAGAGMGSMALSPVAGTIGIGGALALDYSCEDEFYTLEKARDIYNKIEENYLED